MPIKKISGQSRVIDKGSKNITQSVGIGAGKMYSHIPDLVETKRYEMDRHMSFRGKLVGFIIDSAKESANFKNPFDVQSVGGTKKLENIHQIGKVNKEKPMPIGQKRFNSIHN